MIRRFVPVYLITGFIESGKTTLGLTVLANERFTNGGKVLILCCEEGETEWDDKSLEKHKGVLVNLDSSEELTTAKLAVKLGICDAETEKRQLALLRELRLRRW